MTLVFLATIAVGILHGSLFDENSPILWEITLLSVTIGVFLMQILTLGSKINKRFEMGNYIKIYQFYKIFEFIGSIYGTDKSISTNGS